MNSLRILAPFIAFTSGMQLEQGKELWWVFALCSTIMTVGNIVLTHYECKD